MSVKFSEFNVETNLDNVSYLVGYAGSNNQQITPANILNYIKTNLQGVAQGWARYDDTVYTASNKLSLSDEVVVNLPNNGGSTVKSDASIDFYNSTTNRLVADNLNDVYLCTIAFKASASNTTQTHLDFTLTDGDYDRIAESFTFAKGNNDTQHFHTVFQYYADADFLSNGAGLKINSHGGSAQLWDITFFIQRTQYGG